MSDEQEQAAKRLSRIKLVARLVLGVASAIFIAVACYKLASRWESGTARMTSRLTAATMGTTITVSTSDAVKIEGRSLHIAVQKV